MAGKVSDSALQSNDASSMAMQDTDSAGGNAAQVNAGRSARLADRPPRPWRRGLLWLAGLAPLFYLSYGAANFLALQRAATPGAVPAISFGWEQQLPFWAWTIVPYWTINAFYGLSLLLARSRHELDRHGARLLTAQALAVACFLIWPLRFGFSQPAVEGGLPGFLFAGLRSFDAPFNQAPSLHIALAVILWDLYRRLITPPWARWLMHAWALAICASVLTTYQHHFIDIPTGALLGLFCVWAWPLERRASMAQAWRLTRDAKRGKLAALYALGALATALFALSLGGAGLWLLWATAALALVALIYAGFGARGFQTDAQGQMAWAGRWLLAPYRLGAWVNARLWTRHLAPSGEVLPGLWLGHLPGHSGRSEAVQPATHDTAQRARCHRTKIVSLCAELQAPHASLTRCVPMLDLALPTPAALRRAAQAIEMQRQRGGDVRVCCALGFSRSAAATACWLLRSGRAATIDEALAVLRRARPQIVLSAAWLQVIEQAARPVLR